MHAKRRRNLLAKTKGYMWGRKSKIKLARTAVLKAGVNAYKGRKQKKRDFWKADRDNRQARWTRFTRGDG